MAEKEEFQESEVIFSELGSHCYGTLDEEAKNGRLSFNFLKSEKNNNEKKMAASSLPVNISRPRHCCTVFDYGGEFDVCDEDEEGDGGGGGEIVPPHVILGRRIAGKMAFSLCSGNGRTLKGRDLSQVRNAVLRMTGFLEA